MIYPAEHKSLIDITIGDWIAVLFRVTVASALLGFMVAVVAGVGLLLFAWLGTAIK